MGHPSKSGVTTASWLWYGDVLRVAGVIAVVMIHVSAGVVIHPEAFPVSQWEYANILDSMSRWAVPVFVMLSGALLLEPSRREPVGEFFRRRMWRVGLPALFWIVFYFSWEPLFLGKPMNWGSIWAHLIRGNPHGFLYFLYLIIGLYLITPLLRCVIDRAGKSEMMLLVAVGFAFPMAWTALEQWWRVVLPLPMPFLFFHYVGYFVLGYILRDVRLGLGLAWLAPLVWALSVAGVTVVTHFTVHVYGSGGRGVYFYDYLSPGVVVMTISLFLAISQSIRLKSFVEIPRVEKFLRWASSASFGIYLIHYFVMVIVSRERLLPRVPTALENTLLTFATVVVISALAVLLIQRIPYLRRIVG